MTRQEKIIARRAKRNGDTRLASPTPTIDSGGSPVQTGGFGELTLDDIDNRSGDITILDPAEGGDMISNGREFLTRPDPSPTNPPPPPPTPSVNQDSDDDNTTTGGPDSSGGSNLQPPPEEPPTEVEKKIKKAFSPSEIGIYAAIGIVGISLIVYLIKR